MLAILYLLLAWYVGILLVNRLQPDFLNDRNCESLFGDKLVIQRWTIVLPAGFLTGTLLITWINYLATWEINRLLPSLATPLYYGDLVTALVILGLAVFIKQPTLGSSPGYPSSLLSRPLRAALQFVTDNWVELSYVVVWTGIWSFFIYRSFHYTDDTLHIGYSVFSDFSPHLGVIRSFSWGSNYPTEYPHFGTYHPAANNISYHFLFQFLVGNLEYLGLRLDWAMNLPSILAMAAFLLLLHVYARLITGSRWVGIVTSIMVFLRSSFAFFTNLTTLKAAGVTTPLAILTAIAGSTANIGLTLHEDWGFYAQKVFVNKRHYIFALGIALVVLVFMFPLYRKMIFCLADSRTKKNGLQASLETQSEQAKQSQSENLVIEVQQLGQLADTIVSSHQETADTGHSPPLPQQSRLNIVIQWVSTFIASRDSWLPANLRRPVVLGVLLGLLGFVNGAVVVTVLTILFALTFASKHRLEYLVVAVISTALVLLQTRFFVTGNLANTPRLRIGYLSQNPDAINDRLTDAIKALQFDENLLVLLGKATINLSVFYLELLGFLPLLLIGGFFVLPKGGRWLTVAFVSPIVLASIIDFTELPLGVAHVIIIFSVVLLNIIAAYLIVELVRKSNPAWSLGTLLCVMVGLSLAAERFNFMFALNGSLLLLLALAAFSTIALWIIARVLNEFSPRQWLRADMPRTTAFGTALCLLALVTISGMVDAFALYNLDKNSIQVHADNATLEWIRNNVPPDDLILTDTPIIHPVLMAGRKAFAWGSYYTLGAGYDSSERERIIRQVFESSHMESTVEDLRRHGVRYIFVDDNTRRSQSFRFTETFLNSKCQRVFQDPQSGNTSIYLLK